VDHLNTVELKPGIHWVGAIDWDLRNFHGYLTQRGTTYNAYLILDEKVTLVDTVKHYKFDEMMARIRELVDPSDIDYIVSNHVEMDHSGSLPMLKELVPGAKVMTSVQGEKGLRRHHKVDMDYRVVRTGDTLDIGKRTLAFVNVPMVHWPDSMVTYIPEERLLLPNDAFGQHIATHERFDDEVGWSIIREEASKYYANIVMPYGDQVKKALEALGGLDIDMIAPSHGLVLRSYIPKMLGEYVKWANHETEPRAVIVYDTMWGSTERMAYALYEGLVDGGAPVVMRNLKTNHISDIMTDLHRSRLVCLGSATLNNQYLPSMGEFLTYIRGLKPKNRIGFAFGSYGWAPKVIKDLEAVMDELGWDRPVESVNLNFVPDEEELEDVRARGRQLAEGLMEG
jgi:flavorubredoxin